MTPGEETFRSDHEYILQKESEKASKEKLYLLHCHASKYTEPCLEVQYFEINKQVLLCPLVIDRTRKMAWFNILNTLRETQTSKQGIGRLSDTTDQAPINITYEKEDIYHGQAA
jgi:hypothetical protein